MSATHGKVVLEMLSVQGDFDKISGALSSIICLMNVLIGSPYNNDTTCLVEVAMIETG